MHILRKHKRGLLVIIILVIGIPMLFFGITPFWGGGGTMPGTAIVAKVGGVPVVESEFLRRLDEVAQQMGTEERPTNSELYAAGAVDDVLFEFIDQALVRQEAQRRNFKVNEDFLVTQLQQDPAFQDEVGNFVPAKWNAWVKANEENNMNWKQFYVEMNADVERNMYVNQAIAPASRILDKDVDKELEARYTKLKLKFAKVVVEPTEEELLEEYTTNQDSYHYPDKRRAEYVAISLAPEPTDEVNEALTRVKAGEDFGIVASEVSDMSLDEQGDMGWVTRPENKFDPLNALLDLAPGEVSDAVPTAGGFFIFKNEEERMTTPEEEGVEPAREVHGRRILINVPLSAEERQKRVDEATAILEAAKAEGATLAEAAGERSVQTTALFQSGDTEVEGLNTTDVFTFINMLSRTEDGAYSTLVQAARNIYVARVTEVVPGEVMPFEEARERVRNSAINTLKSDEAYAAKVEERAKEIIENFASLEAAKAEDPELTIQETEEFSVKTTSFVNTLFVYANEMYREFAEEEPGTLKGPIQNLLSDTYVVELVSKTPPTTEEQINWAEERDTVRANMMRMAENAYMHDYLIHLREQKLADYGYERYQGTIIQVLGLDQPAADEAPVAPEAAEGGMEGAEEEATPAEG